MTNQRAISRLKDMSMQRTVDASEYNALKMAIKALEQAQKTGHWIRMKAYEKWGCSECNTVFRFTFKEHDYCPNCGCRMVEPQESEE